MKKKAIGQDGISGYILKECRQGMVDPIHDIIECSLKTKKVPKEWKRADMMLQGITQERDGWVDCIYLYFKKSFDKVPQWRLLWKLECV